jgi:hypothetical protein
MKLIEKKRVGTKIIKKHASAQTPVQRLLKHDSITQDKKIQMTNTLKSLDPFALQQQI